jgi:hypothetical protein
MAIGITYKSSVYQTTNTASTFTGSPTWTPAANSLLVCFVCTAYSSSPTDPSGVSGHGVAYSKLTLGTSTLSTTHKLSVWVAKAGASPTSAAPVATVTSTNGTGDLLIEFEITGHDNAGTALQAIVDSTATNNGNTGTSATVTLASAADPDNRAMTFVVQLSNNAPTTAGSWTLSANASGNFNTPATGAAALFDTASFNTAGAATVANNATWRMVGIEIKSALVTHTNTGTPAAQAATVAGTAVHKTLHPTSGTIAAAAAVVAGVAVNAPRLYYVIGPSAGWSDPSASEIKAGQLSGGGAATADGYETAPTVTTAPFTFGAAATGLTPSTNYKIAFVWSDGTNDSNVAVSGDFTTDADGHATTGAIVAAAATVAGSSVHYTLHAATGALAASAATAAGTAAHWHTTTGALTAQAATVAGTSAHLTLHTVTGALAAQAATAAGSASHPHATTGTLAAAAASVSGTAAHRHAATGALAAQASTVAGAAVHLTLHAATGAIAAGSATVAGTATHPHTTTGALLSGAAVVAGSAVRLALHTSTGALAAGAATAAGAAAHVHAATGAVTAGAATVSGTAVHRTLHTTTGTLASQAATIAGDAETFEDSVEHTTTGALSAGAATVSGTAFQAHGSTGALSAQAATVSGAAAHQHATTGALASQAATAAGAADHRTLHTSSGALAAGAATVAGASARVGGHVTTGNLSAQAALVVGAAQRIALHTTTGALSAGAAAATGTAQRYPAGGLSPKHAAWLEALARAHGLIDPLTVSATQRGDGTLVQTVGEAAGAVTLTTTAAPSGADGTSALTAEQATWLERLVRIHGIVDPLVVTAAQRTDGTLTQSIATAGDTTTVQLQ